MALWDEHCYSSIASPCIYARLSQKDCYYVVTTLYCSISHSLHCKNDQYARSMPVNLCLVAIV